MSVPRADAPYPKASPRYVAAFVAGLALLQLAAFGRQWQKGFRPFGPVMPVRVALSWDMFATRIERCDVEWSPPILTPRGPIASVRDLTPLLEWNYILDRTADYHAFGHGGCQFAKGPTRVQLTCFTMQGTEVRDAFPCP